jgi:hypothetical protein
MYSKPRVFVRLSLLTAITVMTAFILFAGRQERASSLPHQQTNLDRQQAAIERQKHNKEALPKIDYAAAESQMEAQSEARKTKSKRYNKGGKPFANLRPDTRGISVAEDSFIPRKALPIEESSIIVVGTITDATGYLSEDKSAAYSEYAINVTEVFKGAAKITNGQIIASRIGGKVVLPTGQTILYMTDDDGTPEIGHRYVVFLKQDPGGDSYSIITAYELIDGHAKALDTDERYGVFENSQEATFLDILRTSLK